MELIKQSRNGLKTTVSTTDLFRVLIQAKASIEFERANTDDAERAADLEAYAQEIAAFKNLCCLYID